LTFIAVLWASPALAWDSRLLEVLPLVFSSPVVHLEVCSDANSVVHVRVENHEVVANTVLPRMPPYEPLGPEDYFDPAVPATVYTRTTLQILHQLVKRTGAPSTGSIIIHWPGGIDPVSGESSGGSSHLGAPPAVGREYVLALAYPRNRSGEVDWQSTEPRIVRRQLLPALERPTSQAQKLTTSVDARFVPTHDEVDHAYQEYCSTPFDGMGPVSAGE